MTDGLILLVGGIATGLFGSLLSISLAWFGVALVQRA